MSAEKRHVTVSIELLSGILFILTTSTLINVAVCIVVEEIEDLINHFRQSSGFNMGLVLCAI